MCFELLLISLILAAVFLYLKLLFVFDVLWDLIQKGACSLQFWVFLSLEERMEVFAYEYITIGE